MMKVLLTGGGSSREREVSLKTSAAMARALDELGYDFRYLELDNELDIPKYWDDSYGIVLLGFHGRTGEDGLVQALLDSYGIPYTGAGVTDSLLAFSKEASKRLFRQHNVPTADWDLISHIPGTALPAIGLELPFVLKPDNEGSTIGLSVCQHPEDLKAAETVSGKFRKLLVETFIPGRELTVGVLGDDVFPVVEIFPGHELYDYDSKYTKGMSHYECPAKLPNDLTKYLQQLARQAMQAVGVQVYGRVDFRLDPDNNPWCLEINTLPGMTETSLLPMGARAYELSFPQLVEKIIEQSLKKY